MRPPTKSATSRAVNDVSSASMSMDSSVLTLEAATKLRARFGRSHQTRHKLNFIASRVALGFRKKELMPNRFAAPSPRQHTSRII